MINHIKEDSKKSRKIAGITIIYLHQSYGTTSKRKVALCQLRVVKQLLDNFL